MSKILASFSSLGYMDESNRKIVLHGLQRIKNLILDVLIATLCGLVMKNLMAALLYEAAFIPLRINAGGYHAQSEKMCKLISWGSIVGSMAVIIYLPGPEILWHILTALSCTGIMILAPVESKNKPLSMTEKKVFRRRSMIIVIMEGGIYFLLAITGCMLYARVIGVVIVLVAGGMIADIEVMENSGCNTGEINGVGR